MRKASEADDHLAVAMRKVDVARHRRIFAHGFEQADGLVLVRQRLAVLERQVDEGAGDIGQLPVQAPRHHIARQRQRLSVGGESLGRTAEQIARELIAQNQPGQAAAGVAGIRRQLPGARLPPGFQETLADNAVEYFILLEPAARGSDRKLSSPPPNQNSKMASV